jgi:hypothetical protein
LSGKTKLQNTPYGSVRMVRSGDTTPTGIGVAHRAGGASHRHERVPRFCPRAPGDRELMMLAGRPDARK